jgi:hypothetical protein
LLKHKASGWTLYSREVSKANVNAAFQQAGKKTNGACETIDLSHNYRCLMHPGCNQRFL